MEYIAVFFSIFLLNKDYFGALRGCLKNPIAPLEGVADKQQSGENWLCLQRQFMERLAWKTGEGFPLQGKKNKEQ